MHVEITLDLAPFFLEQHRQQKTGSEPATESRQHPGSTTGRELRRRMAVLAEQIRPDYDVPIFDVGEAGVDVLLFWIRLGCGEDTIEVSSIRLVLPMVLEGVNVDLGRVRWCGARLQQRGHASISPLKAAFAPFGNLPA